MKGKALATRRWIRTTCRGGDAGFTVFPEVVDVEAYVSLPLLRQPAKVEELFTRSDGDVGRRHCEASAVRDGVIDSA